MPSEEDYQFGKKAVALGYMRQGQIEDCIELLVALERAGSQQRLWDVAKRRHYIGENEVGDILRQIGVSKAPAAQQPQDSGAPESATLAHVVNGACQDLVQVTANKIIIGSKTSCSMALNEPGVADEHAVLRRSAKGWLIESIGPRNVVINHQRVSKRHLPLYSLIQIGEAMLLLLPAQGHDAGVADGKAALAAKLATSGEDGKKEYFLQNEPLLLGTGKLCNVRIFDKGTSEVHAHIATHKDKFYLADLRSRSGTRLNGLKVVSRALRDGDVISVAKFDFKLEIVRPAEEQFPHVEAPAGELAPLESRGEWDIAEEVEVEAAVDQLIRRGIVAPEESPDARPAPVAHKPGELQVSCTAGPLEGKTFVIKRSRFVFGRAEGLDVTIPDATISRRHARIVLGPEHAEVEDMKSRNGIFLNGRRVQKDALRLGDAIRIGTSVFVVEKATAHR